VNNVSRRVSTRRRAWRALRASSLSALLILSGGAPVAAQSTPSAADAARFLEQATFGPTAVDLAHVQDPNVGFDGWLMEQFGMPGPNDYVPMETCPTGTGRCPDQPPTGCGSDCVRINYTMHDLQLRFFQRALNAPDQLRQRVAFALNQIMVTSAQDGNLNRLNRMQPYVQVLEQDAFGNFQGLLYDITLNAGMGRYLDMVNNNKNAPNENYAREILQLFSIGLDKLNPDGTPILDPQGNRVPTYTQDTITNFARVFTGWVFAPQPDPLEAGYVNYIDPMIVGNANSHDQLSKTLLDHGGPGCAPPGGEDAPTELGEALSCIMSSPYVAPYISKNLIQHLVTSNPTPTYVADVSSAFTNGSFTDPATGQVFSGGTGPGDLQAVIAAILLDPEARGDTAPSAYAGHLREPVLFITNLLRAFNTSDLTGSSDYVLGDLYLPADVRMDQDVYRAPTVFNFFPPSYAIPGETSCAGSGTPQCLGPEFNIQSTATSLARVNFAQEVVFHQMPTNADRPMGTWLDENTLTSLPTDDPQVLVDTLNAQMMHGSMATNMNARLFNAVSAITDPDPTLQALNRAREAVYLIATSAEYNVER
jgi:uncharacterized protein (DUF1800 family)